MISSCEQTRRSPNLHRADSPRVCSHLPTVSVRCGLGDLERAMPANGRPELPIPDPTPHLLRHVFGRLNIPDKCWEWNGVTRNGYSQIGIKGTSYYLHRLFFRWFKYEIPDGLVIDHLCNNTRCLNPHHMEATTAKQNIGRATSKKYCKRGHHQIPENRYTEPKAGRSRCGLCISVRNAEVRAARRARGLKKKGRKYEQESPSRNRALGRNR